MQFAVPSQFRSHAIPHSLPSRLRAAACCGAMMALMPLALHAADNLVTIDPTMIATLQLRAEQAAPRDQMQLFADLADKISLLATKQIADGDDEHAQATLKQLEACTAQMEITMKLDSKGLKKAEMLLHTTNRRLKDLVRGASGDMKPVVQSALKRLDQAQTSLLSAVFAK
ncbi:hypothetical protein [Terriglobus roseus]|uniref:Uncharacterized protein n=1 Tax=Terriglobus roseus TaxID=392734 RepID=A0A1G7ILF0_9BACT|nr:hypothetical protein [Terriglobus roseus]SDF13356.1 hypothetical protein SAMN05444167_1489 [Terriglobus roseus]